MRPTALIPVGSRYFEYLPIGLFGSVMGLTGLSIAWRLAHLRYGAPIVVSQSIAALAALDFVLLTCAYAVKFSTARDTVLGEVQHPIAGATFATFWVSLLLLPIVLASVNLLLAQTLWAVGVAGIVPFAWYILSRWLRDRHQAAQAAPAWILPVVGLLDMPLAVPYLAVPHSQEAMVAGLAIGLFFAVPLFTMVFARLVFAPPMPPALEPSLFILVAPFAVGMSTYVATTGQVDLFAKSLYFLTIFMATVLLARLRHLARCCPFKVGWWAVSFPLAASAIASLRMAQIEPSWGTHAIALALLALASLVILWMLARTSLGMARGELRMLST